MGKKDGGFLTPKAIANRIKAKGLQKLRWYCQMCQKQCRDENGFKCHCMSESHRRQMGIFAHNPGRFMNEFSREFESNYLRILSHTYGTKRVHANTVYQDLIRDRNHLHMNSTVWASLTGFVRHLSRAGKCVIDYQEEGGLPGWYVQWIEKDPEKDARQARIREREEAEIAAEKRHRAQLERQRESAAKLEGDKFVSGATGLDRKAVSGPVKMSFGIKMKGKEKEEEEESGYKRTYDDGYGDDFPIDPSELPDPGVSMCDDGDDVVDGDAEGDERVGHSVVAIPNPNKRKERPPLSALEEIKMEEEKKMKKDRRDYWLRAGIVVKVINKKLDSGKYYKKKGRVDEVEERYTAILTMLDSGTQLSIDQAELETVIPAVGGRVMIVNGGFRGEIGKLKSVNVNDFCASIEIDSGPRRGLVVNNVEYEDFSKLSMPTK